MKRVIIAALVVLMMGFANNTSAREVIKLNKGWRLSASLNDRGGSIAVNLPHVIDEEAAEAADARGGYYYTKRFTAPDSWLGKLTFIRFKGVASVATVFVNGKYVGEHKGAFTAFTFDISPFIRVGEENTIVVNVNNSQRYNIFPLTGDYNLYGGIYREVEMIVTDRLHITPTHFSTSGVYVTQTALNDTDATLLVKAMTAGQYGDKGTIRTTIFEGDKAISTKSSELAIGLEGSKDMFFDFTISNPRRWNGRKDPFMYTCLVEVLDIEGKVIDSVKEHFGVRGVSISRSNGFILNNSSYPLYGVTYLQDWADIKSAFSLVNTAKDIELINEIGATAIRCANYPHNTELYDLTDRSGIITWVDIPFTGDFNKNSHSYINLSELKLNGDAQLQEMLYQLYNHPSVVFIGLFSNIAGYSDSPIDFVETLNDRVKGINNNVITVGCSNEDGALNNITDAISWSQYFGWNSSKSTDISLWLDTFKKDWMKLKPAIGEYGAGGSIYHQDEGQTELNRGGRWYPEGFQTEFHITYSNALINRPYIWGYFINSMFDYGVPRVNNRDGVIINNMGLITYDRAVKKDAFYLYKALWNKDKKFIHIAGKRRYDRSGNRQDIRIFTNCGSIDISVNGVAQTTMTVKNGVAEVKSLNLKNGVNVITARSGGVEDELYINVVPGTIL